MKALTVEPGAPGSLRLEEVAEPTGRSNTILARTLAIGVCGTDRELSMGQYGSPPPGRKRLIIGHESLARVESAPPGSGFVPGDLIVGIVRRPDPVPCANCREGRWDMCLNGQYTECGIKERDGFCSELIGLEPDFAVKVDRALGSLAVLLEPTSVVAKAWEQIGRIGQRSCWAPRRALITGAGPVGLLAALLGVQRGLEVHVFDRVTSGPKPELVRALGAVYHTGDLSRIGLQPDIVVECTGVPEVIIDAINATAPTGIVCLAGVSTRGYRIPIDVGVLDRTMVLENHVVFGSVNANRAHYQAAAEALGAADAAWLQRMVTRRVALEKWPDAFERRTGDIKTVIQLAA